MLTMQTSSGKTHTMEGPDIYNEKLRGIIPRAVEGIFKGVSKAETSIEFSLKVTYIEIYMEKIRDLLDVHRVKNNLNIREDKVNGIHVAGVTEEYVASQQEVCL
jgi:kinesin family member 5